jgi:hypothetical protein
MPYKTGQGNEKAYKDANGNYVGLVYHEDSDTILMMRADANGNISVTSQAAYGRTEYDYDVNKDLIYKGYHDNYLADGSESDWIIIKYTYDVDVDLETKQIQTGVWDNRTILSW